MPGNVAERRLVVAGGQFHRDVVAALGAGRQRELGVEFARFGDLDDLPHRRIRRVRVRGLVVGAGLVLQPDDDGRSPLPVLGKPAGAGERDALAGADLLLHPGDGLVARGLGFEGLVLVQRLGDPHLVVEGADHGEVDRSPALPVGRVVQQRAGEHADAVRRAGGELRRELVGGVAALPVAGRRDRVHGRPRDLDPPRAGGVRLHDRVGAAVADRRPGGRVGEQLLGVDRVRVAGELGVEEEVDHRAGLAVGGEVAADPFEDDRLAGDDLLGSAEAELDSGVRRARAVGGAAGRADIAAGRDREGGRIARHAVGCGAVAEHRAVQPPVLGRPGLLDGVRGAGGAAQVLPGGAGVRGALPVNLRLRVAGRGGGEGRRLAGFDQLGLRLLDDHRTAGVGLGLRLRIDRRGVRVVAGHGEGQPGGARDVRTQAGVDAGLVAVEGAGERLQGEAVARLPGGVGDRFAGVRPVELEFEGAAAVGPHHAPHRGVGNGLAQPRVLQQASALELAEGAVDQLEADHRAFLALVDPVRLGQPAGAGHPDRLAGGDGRVVGEGGAVRQGVGGGVAGHEAAAGGGARPGLGLIGVGGRERVLGVGDERVGGFVVSRIGRFARRRLRLRGRLGSLGPRLVGWSALLGLGGRLRRRRGFRALLRLGLRLRLGLCLGLRLRLRLGLGRHLLRRRRAGRLGGVGVGEAGKARHQADGEQPGEDERGQAAPHSSSPSTNSMMRRIRIGPPVEVHSEPSTRITWPSL